jgi:uncharacterized membrane protein HdeD (DUF308 family)
LTILAVLLCFFPLIIYAWKRLVTNKSYMVISIFWTINGILYIPELFHWHWYDEATNMITFYYNLFDGPLMFLTFYYAYGKKIFLYMILAFAIFEGIIISWKGFNNNSDNIIIGIGSLICLLLCFWAIAKYFMKVEHSDAETVLVFVFAGFMFYYGLFAVIYRYNYIVHNDIQKNLQKPYVMLINWIAICLACGLISFGFARYAHTEYLEEKY